ncbi:MAG: peptidoglycan bridge formation glycyltransferase FemA/FemB family protein [Candidatus Peribacter sp.]|jgi:lipid II:glycine glycyltransferase (peptidoglycan interpeptide bridge formation enzyme)
MTIQEATNPQEWDAFLALQQFRPFLQSWTMGEVYRDTGQEPIRMEVRDEEKIVAICQAILVPARRGRHLSIPYGPVISSTQTAENSMHVLKTLLEELKKVAREHQCCFIRMSPFWPLHPTPYTLPPTFVSSPLHLLAEHLWFLPLIEPDPWALTQTSNEQRATSNESPLSVTEELLLKNMRKTTRNLIRRTERDGVTVEASKDPSREIEHFLALHEETRQRHGFTPYTNTFFRSQVRRFSERNECTLYLARFQGEVAAASIHMHAFGETSYHHGASTHRLSKIPASYLLQWTAIRDALRRGDHVYNFWGIAPLGQEAESSTQQVESSPSPKSQVPSPKSDHPFAGVTLFKTGFGGSLLPLTHCMDFPLSARYHLTRAFELLRKWRRGF